jgi:hypothetical protein
MPASRRATAGQGSARSAQAPDCEQGAGQSPAAAAASAPSRRPWPSAPGLRSSPALRFKSRPAKYSPVYHSGPPRGPRPARGPAKGRVHILRLARLPAPHPARAVSLKTLAAAGAPSAAPAPARPQPLAAPTGRPGNPSCGRGPGAGTPLRGPACASSAAAPPARRTHARHGQQADPGGGDETMPPGAERPLRVRLPGLAGTRGRVGVVGTGPQPPRRARLHGGGVGFLLVREVQAATAAGLPGGLGSFRLGWPMDSMHHTRHHNCSRATAAPADCSGPLPAAWTSRSSGIRMAADGPARRELGGRGTEPACEGGCGAEGPRAT